MTNSTEPRPASQHCERCGLTWPRGEQHTCIGGGASADAPLDADALLAMCDRSHAVLTGFDYAEDAAAYLDGNEMPTAAAIIREVRDVGFALTAGCRAAIAEARHEKERADTARADVKRLHEQLLRVTDCGLELHGSRIENERLRAALQRIAKLKFDNTDATRFGWDAIDIATAALAASSTDAAPASGEVPT